MIEEIADYKKFLRKYVREHADSVLVVDKNGEIILLNKQAENLFGYSESELQNQKIEILLPEHKVKNHHKHREDYYKHPYKRGLKYGKEFLARHKNGRVFPVEISLCPLELANESFTIAQVVDISQQKELLSTLKESHKKLASIIETAIDGIITINDKGIIESANPSAQRLFGYSEEELKGQNVSTLMGAPHRAAHDGYIKAYQKSRDAKIIGIGREVEGVRKDGTTFPFWLSVSEVVTEDRTIFTGLIHDLTEQKRAERKLQASADELAQRVEARTAALADAIRTLENEVYEKEMVQKELERNQAQIQTALEKERKLNELKSRFVSTASHEFRTPLATILSSINLIDKYHDPDKKEKRIKHINRIKSNVKNLTNILNDFLSLSKLEEGVIEVKPEYFNLESFIEELKEDFQLQIKKGQKILVQQSDGIGNVYLDRYLLKNIMTNLLSNAIKYSPEKSNITILANTDKDYISIAVKDQGIGIPEEEQEQLFERFFRARNATNIQGTGLGLSIVKKYMELLEGEISFESISGKGTTFTIKFEHTA